MWTCAGIGARRIEVTEEHKILSASTVFFDASTSSHSGPRRTRSVGPGLAVDRDEDEHEEDSGGHDEPSGSHPRWLVGEDRRFSADNSVWQRDVVSHSEDPPSFDDAMTPPYTPTPAATPRTSSGRINELPSTDPGHQLEEFRNALRSGLDTEREFLRLDALYWLNTSPKARRRSTEKTRTPTHLRPAPSATSLSRGVRATKKQSSTRTRPQTPRRAAVAGDAWASSIKAALRPRRRRRQRPQLRTTKLVRGDDTVRASVLRQCRTCCSTPLRTACARAPPGRAL